MRRMADEADAMGRMSDEDISRQATANSNGAARTLQVTVGRLDRVITVVGPDGAPLLVLDFRMPGGSAAIGIPTGDLRALLHTVAELHVPPPVSPIIVPSGPLGLPPGGHP